MRITNKGQITIPLHIRKFLGILPPNTEIEFIVENGRVYLEKSQSLVEKLRGKGRIAFSTDLVMALTRDKE